MRTLSLVLLRDASMPKAADSMCMRQFLKACVIPPTLNLVSQYRKKWHRLILVPSNMNLLDSAFALFNSRQPNLGTLDLTQRLQSSSFLGLTDRILSMNPQKELLWSLWVHSKPSKLNSDPKP